MAISYNDWKKKYEGLNDTQRQNYLNMTKNDATAQQYMTQYNNEKNTVYTPSTTQNVTQPTNTFGDTGGASQAKQYTGTGVSSAGNYNYNPNLKTNSLQSGSLVFGGNAELAESRTPGYLEQRNNAIANALYNEGKTDRQSVENYLLTFDDYKNYDDIGRKNTIDAIMNRFGTMDSLANKNSLTQGDMFDNMRKQAVDNYNQSEKGLGNIMGGENYAKTFDEAVANKLNSAFGMDLNEFKSRYPDQYDSLIQSLETIRGTWDATDPTQRQLLDGYLQQVIGASVGAGSDISKLKRFEESIKSKFKNPDKMSEDMRNIVKLQTEGKSISEIANEMGISEEQVNNAILAYNGLDNELGKFYTLTDEAAKKVTEPYDIKQQRLDEEKKIALDRANRNVEWLKQDYDTNMERQKKQNDINAHNADAIAGRTGLAFSKRGIEGINYVNDQGKQILDDLTKNYDRNNIQMADGIADIIRNYNYNTQDITKASEEALTKAKNNYTANVLAIQQQYGTVGLQAQQAIANSVQNFIQQAENIFDNDLQRRQQNLSNLIDNVANINALQVQNLALRNQQIAQFQTESLNYNRSQLQQLASELGMGSEDYQALINYQVQATADMLNNYAPGTGYTFQNEIKSLLDQGYTPNEAVGMIAKSQAFQQATATQNPGNWSSAGGQVIFNTATGESKYIGTEGLTGVAGTGVQGGTDGMFGFTNYTPISSEQLSSGLQSFESSHPVNSTGGQCGAFVNDYLQSLGLDRLYTDPIDKKKAVTNTDELVVGGIAVMDSKAYPQYGHTAIIKDVQEVQEGKTMVQLLESNRGDDKKVHTRRVNADKILGVFDPSKDMNSSTSGMSGYTSGSFTRRDGEVFNTTQAPTYNSLSYDKQNTVRGLLNLSINPSTITKRQYGDDFESILSAAQEINPNWSTADYGQADKAKKEWNTSSKNGSNSRNATAMATAKEVREMADIIGNTTFKDWNTMLNKFRDKLSNENYIRLKVNLQTMASEFAGALKGGNAAPTEKEIEDAKQMISESFSNGGMKAAAEQIAKQLYNKNVTEADNYRNVTLQKPKSPRIGDVPQWMYNQAGIDISEYYDYTQPVNKSLGNGTSMGTSGGRI